MVFFLFHEGAVWAYTGEFGSWSLQFVLDEEACRLAYWQALAAACLRIDTWVRDNEERCSCQMDAIRRSV